MDETNTELFRLMDKVRALERENEILKKELAFLRTFPALAQGIKGETLVAQLTGGVLTGYAESHDVSVTNGDRLEVKYSHLNDPNRSKTRRWNWNSPLGRRDEKDYSFLILVGEKDPRFEDQYPPDLAFVFFLVPRADVWYIKTGSNIALNTNLRTANAAKSEALKQYLVRSGATFKNLFSSAATP